MSNMGIVYHNRINANMNATMGCMALFIRQDDNRSKLQERLAAELQDRAKQRALSQDRPDGVDDSKYLQETKTTSSLMWLWILVILIAVGGVVWLTVANTSG